MTDSLPEDGSTLYYVSRFLPLQYKDAVLLLHAIHKEITSIPLSCSDPGVARIKLEWWRDECERISHHAARHPLGKQFQIHQDDFKEIHTEILQSIIDSAEENIAPNSIDTEIDRVKYIDSGPACIWHLSLKIGSNLEADALTVAEQLIRCSVWLEQLQLFYPMARKGRCLIPETTLQRYHLDSFTLLEQTEQTKTSEMLLAEYNRIRQELTDACQSARFMRVRELLPYRVYAQLSLALCKEILSANSIDPKTHTDLTPFRKAWISFLVQAGLL